MNVKQSTYRPISQFGSNSYAPSNNPLTYCLNNTMDNRFLHGGNADTLGQHSKACQSFLSDYCSEKWDGFCEIASRNTNTNYPNNIQACTGLGDIASKNMNAGDALIRNTASKKYLVSMGNCKKKYEPFDPTVATSPMISYWISDSCGRTCVPVYVVDPDKIDSDIVMDKILRNPMIGIDILINIYNTMKRMNTLENLTGTKLGNFYATNPYFVSKGGL
jgi:hypothetical protein